MIHEKDGPSAAARLAWIKAGFPLALLMGKTRKAQTGKWWRRRWTVGSLMIAIAVLCSILSLVRPLATPAPVRAAEVMLRQLGPLGLDLNLYRLDSVTQTPSGYWHVDYVRVSRSGPPRQGVMVSDQLVRKVRFNPWYTLPPLGSTRTVSGPQPLNPNVEVAMPAVSAPRPQPASKRPIPNPHTSRNEPASESALESSNPR